MKLSKMSYLILVTVIFLVAGCSKDFLSPKPKSFFTEENALTDPAGFKALLITLQSDLKSEFIGAKSNIPQQWELSDAGIPLLQSDLRRLTPSKDPFENYEGQINNFYKYIKDANIVISRIDDIKWKDQDERDEILAKALWNRAYWYYRLVGNYGDVPWVGKEIEGAKLDFNTYSRSAILHKIQTDLEWAVPHLPESAGPGELTKAAGNMLLTKVYLANLEFDKAIKSASKIIDSGKYHLMRNRFGKDKNDPSKNVIWDLNRPYNKNIPENKETILAIVDRYEAPEDARSSGLGTMRAYHPEWWSGTTNRDSEGKPGMVEENHKFGQWDSLGHGNPEMALDQWYQYDIWKEGKYTWKNTPDLRRADANWKDISEVKYNNPESVNYGDPWQFKWMTGPRSGVYWHMYAMPIYITSVPPQQKGANPLGGNGDWYVYRLAGTYLLRAEAYYWKGELGLAADDINKVKKRAHAPLISPGNVTVEAIFNERVRELFAQSPRQNELVRVSYIMAKKGMNGYALENLSKHNWWFHEVKKHNCFYPQYNGARKKSLLGLPLPVGDKLTVVGQSPHVSPYNFLWPIDDNLITNNTKGRINQTKGYTGAENNKPPKTEIPESNYDK
jgi:hypothetical protein